jgi:hypothetical protein
LETDNAWTFTKEAQSKPVKKVLREGRTVCNFSYPQEIEKKGACPERKSRLLLHPMWVSALLEVGNIPLAKIVTKSAAFRAKKSILAANPYCLRA